MPEVQKWRKDIIKVECPIDTLDLDILGFIDHNITVNIIQNGEIVEKKNSISQEIRNVIKCKNPRCITSIEQELDQVFFLADEEEGSVPLQILWRKIQRKQK